MIELRTLGGLDVRDSDGEEIRPILAQPKRLALLIYLALTPPPSFRRRDSIIALFWPELDQDHARGSLRQALRFLRRTLGEGVIVSRGEEEIGVASSLLWCDAIAFERACRSGDVRQALELYPDDFLAGFYVSDAAPEFERWIEDERMRFRRQAGEAAWALAISSRAAGDEIAAAGWARRAITYAPNDEGAVRRLIHLLDTLGDRAGAIEAYEEFAARMALEFEAEPSIETRQLIETVRTRPRTDQVVPSPPPAQSIAVLSFLNMSGDPDNEYFGDGIAEELINLLTGVKGLHVASRTSAFAFKGTKTDPRTIGQALKVRTVLEGSVRKAGNRLRISAQLINAADGYHLWSERYDREMADVFAVQDEISQTIVKALKVSVASSEAQRSRTPPTTNPEAYDDFLRGKIHVLRMNREDYAIATEALERAVARDPNFAAAYAYLAFAYGQWIFLFAPHDAATLEKGLVAVEKALRLEPDLAEAHFARGFLLWTPASHFAHELAIREFRRAIALNPNLAEGHHWLGVVYWHIGLFEKAIEQFQETEAIDAGNRLAQGGLAAVLTYQGRYEEGLRTARAIPREQNSPMWTYHVVWDLLYLHRTEEASTVIQDYLKTSPQDPGGLITGVRAILHAKNGDARRAVEDIDRAAVLGKGYGHFHHTAYNIASAYALLGQPGPAVQWLHRAIDDGLPCYPLFEKDPNLDHIRQDPSFVARMAELKSDWERWEQTL